MKQEITEIIRQALDILKKQGAIESFPDIEVEIPKNEAMGDFATNVAMQLTRILKIPPRKIAEEIVEK